MSISNRFITWDLSTSDLTRDVNPGIEGIMQQLVLSPDNKWAAAYTNINQVSHNITETTKNLRRDFKLFSLQTVLLNMLSSEFQLIENPLKEEEEEEEDNMTIDTKSDSKGDPKNDEPVENVIGVFLLNQNLIVYGPHTWVIFNMRAEKQQTHKSPMNPQEWPILCEYFFVAV